MPHIMVEQVPSFLAPNIHRFEFHFSEMCASRRHKKESISHLMNPHPLHVLASEVQTTLARFYRLATYLNLIAQINLIYVYILVTVNVVRYIDKLNLGIFNHAEKAASINCMQPT